jgi:PAS domain S-box-containing protein
MQIGSSCKRIVLMNVPNRIDRFIPEPIRRQLNRLVEQRWFDVSLRTKMSLMVTVGLAGLLTAFALLGMSTTSQATRQAMAERVTLARMGAQTLDTSLNQIESILKVLAAQPAVQNPQADDRERAAVLGKVELVNHGLFLYDRDYQLVFSSQHELAQIEWSRLTVLVNSIQSNQFELGLVTSLAEELGLEANIPWVLMAVPVHDPQGAVIGALAALVHLNDAQFFSFERPLELSGTVTLDVVDATGRILLSADPSRIMQASEEPGVLADLFVADKPGVENCLGCVAGENSEGRDEVIAFAPLNEAPWGVVVRQKSVEVFAPTRRLMVVNLILGAVTTLGALGLVWVTTNSVINPVQELTDAAIRIAEGDLDTPVELRNPKSHRRDEIGALALSFITMRRQLKRSIGEIQALNRDLDARVQERTQAALQAQHEAQNARDDLRAIIDAISDELVVLDVNTKEIQQVNRSAQDLHPEFETVIGRSFYEVYPCENQHPKNGCRCPIPDVLSTGASVQVTHVHPGEEPGEKRYLDIVASPMRDAGGNITRVVELMRDVTEEKRIKESLIRRNIQLGILNAIAITVNQSLNLEEILNRALEEVLRLTAVDVGAVFLQAEMLGKLELAAYQGLSEEAARVAAQMGMLDGSCGGVVDKGEVVLVPDLALYRGHRARSLKRERLTSLMHVPLMSKGFTLGSMCVGTRARHQFSEEEREMLTAIGSQIAVAIENARLYAEVQQKEHIRGELFQKAINAQEEERKRIARELHDETSQNLTALLFLSEEVLEMDDLEQAQKRLARMQSLVKLTLDGVHKIIFDLRPSMLDHLGLVPALRWYAESRLSPKEVRVEIKEASRPRRLPAEVETALFRVVQEAINNVARHAAARNVRIEFEFEDQAVKVEVEDDGIGFDIGSSQTISPENGRGLGLMGMQERIELLGGEISVETNPGFGTLLVIQVPLVEGSLTFA